MASAGLMAKSGKEIVEMCAMVAVRKTHTARLRNCTEHEALKALREVAEEIRSIADGHSETDIH